MDYLVGVSVTEMVFNFADVVHYYRVILPLSASKIQLLLRGESVENSFIMILIKMALPKLVFVWGAPFKELLHIIH